MGTDMEQAGFSLKLTEAGEIVLLTGADRINLGSKDAVCEEMTRFLAQIDFGE